MDDGLPRVSPARVIGEVQAHHDRATRNGSRPPSADGGYAEQHRAATKRINRPLTQTARQERGCRSCTTDDELRPPLPASITEQSPRRHDEGIAPASLRLRASASVVPRSAKANSRAHRSHRTGPSLITPATARPASYRSSFRVGRDVARGRRGGGASSVSSSGGNTGASRRFSNSSNAGSTSFLRSNSWPC